MLFQKGTQIPKGEIFVENKISLPTNFSPEPDVTEPDLYYTLMYILGTMHNVFSVLTLVSYFLSNHPQFPNVLDRIKKVR